MTYLKKSIIQSINEHKLEHANLNYYPNLHSMHLIRNLEQGSKHKIKGKFENTKSKNLLLELSL